MKEQSSLQDQRQRQRAAAVELYLPIMYGLVIFAAFRSWRVPVLKRSHGLGMPDEPVHPAGITPWLGKAAVAVLDS